MPQAVALGSWDLGWDRALAHALEYAQLLDSPAPPAGHLWSRACPSRLRRGTRRPGLCCRSRPGAVSPEALSLRSKFRPRRESHQVLIKKVLVTWGQGPSCMVTRHAGQARTLPCQLCELSALCPLEGAVPSSYRGRWPLDQLLREADSHPLVHAPHTFTQGMRITGHTRAHAPEDTHCTYMYTQTAHTHVYSRVHTHGAHAHTPSNQRKLPSFVLRDTRVIWCVWRRRGRKTWERCLSGGQ